MNIPRVYADFNSIEYQDAAHTSATVGLTGYGTIASLSKLKLQLTEGQQLLLYEPNDIEVEGVAFFDRKRIDPAGRPGEWMARLDPRNIRDAMPTTESPHEHPCFGCGYDLLPHLKAVGQRYIEICPNCGTSVMAPLEPPKAA
jgi:hypothetical protein